MDALIGLDARLGAIDPRQAAQLRLERLRIQAEAGELETAKLQEKLRSVFGENGMGVLGEDGGVDFEYLQNLIDGHGTARLILALTETLNNTDVHADIIDSGNDIRENFIERNQAIARERLRNEFGVDAEEFIDATGTLDFEALREFLDQQRVNVERLQNLDLGPASLIDIKT